MNKTIQQLRGLAIIAVVIIHTCPGGVPGVLIRPFVNFAVAMFIFLSGYLTRIEFNGGTMKKRMSKVLIPYVVFSVIYMVVNGTIHQPILTVIRIFLFGSASYHLYYILVYIQLVLITPLALRLARSKDWPVGLFITPVFMLFFRYIVPIFDVSILNRSIHKIFLFWFLYYYIGILLGNGIYKPKIRSKNLILLYCVACVVQIMEGVIWLRLGYADISVTQLKASSLIASVVACLIAYRMIEEKQGKIYPVLVKIGDWSFGIYLIHCLFIFALPFPINTVVALTVSCCLVFSYYKIKPSGFR